MINRHTLETLEYHKIIARIKELSLTPYGRDEIVKISPFFEIEPIKKRMRGITELRDIENFGLPFPLYRSEDCREVLEKSVVDGIKLEAREFFLVKELVETSTQLYRYDKDHRENFPLITEHLENIRSFPELNKDIEKVIDHDGSIKDSASSELRRIRNSLLVTRKKIINKLNKLVSSKKSSSGRQDDLVTIRNNRYVITIAASSYKSDIGILHDRSQSGATFFVEPKESVELNNQLHLLAQEELLEIDRILRALTKEVSIRREPLQQNCQIIGKIDLIHACATFSNKTNGSAVRINPDASFDLIEIRHPLLILQLGGKEKVVPNSLSLDDSRQVILITGPNTGGKTIVLKTTGLLLLMAQSGLHIPADEKSEVGIFENIFADIGDEQSIELSLSTFSSHIRNIIDGLSEANSRTFLLFDEIGAGTDPKEGSALAEAIILHAIDKKARMIVTTHYSQLKTLAMEYPQIENGSLEFDRETLSPTYHLQLGMPGSSYAVEIAGRLGMPESICTQAQKLIGSEEKSLNSLISSLEKELIQIKKDREKLTERLGKAEQLQLDYEEKLNRLTNELSTDKREALLETRAFVESTRTEIERLVAEIRKTQASKESLKEFHQKLKATGETLAQKLAVKTAEPVSSSDFKVGDRVEVLSLNQNGQIEELIGKEKAKIKIGNMFTTVALRNLMPAEQTGIVTNKRKRNLSSSYSVDAIDSNQIHLRGMTVDEAMEQLERFLDKAVISGLEQVYVIHGKGTGKLRRILSDYLKARNEVDSIRLGDYNEGGAGVTVVRLKN